VVRRAGIRQSSAVPLGTPEVHFEKVIGQSKGLLCTEVIYLPKDQIEAIVPAIRPATDGKARAAGSIGRLPVAHDEEVDGARLVQAVSIHEAAHGFLAGVGGARAASIVAESRVPRHVAKYLRGRAGQALPRVGLRERHADKKEGGGSGGILVEGRGHF